MSSRSPQQSRDQHSTPSDNVQGASADFCRLALVLRPALVQVGMDFFASADDAEDVAQEALMRLWEFCSRMGEPRNVRALAVRIAKNVCVDIQRHRHGHLFVPLDDDGDGSLYDGAGTPHEQLELREATQRFRKALAALDRRERQLLEMRVLHNLPAADIARRTGIPKASVLSMISMAKRKIINLLNSQR